MIGAGNHHKFNFNHMLAHRLEFITSCLRKVLELCQRQVDLISALSTGDWPTHGQNSTGQIGSSYLNSFVE